MIIVESSREAYALTDRLSEGRTEVYLCQSSTDRYICRLFADAAGSGSAFREFLYGKPSPYLMRLLDDGVNEIRGRNRAFEIYEYLEEGTLTARVPFSEEIVRDKIIPEINEAVHAMHEAGFLHRDIKPDNLYQDKNHYKLGDFDVSVKMQANGTYSDAALALTPGYVPAEVLGSGTYSPASDYYAFAVTIYYLLTGKQIYDGLTPDEIMARTRSGVPGNFYGVSPHMASLLEGLTVQDPRYRWGFNEVKAWLDGAAVPVFRYGQDRQLLDPPYRLTLAETCRSLRELAGAMMRHPREAQEHLYGGYIADSLRTQYQHISNALTDLVKNHFPKARRAGLATAIHLLNPDMKDLYWDGTLYHSFREVLDEFQNQAASNQLDESFEEMLGSGILSSFYAQSFSPDDLSVMRVIERQARSEPMDAACALLTELSPAPCYQTSSGEKAADISEYIDILARSDNLSSRLYEDFNKHYFRFWMKARGYQDKMTEWLNFFYKDGRVRRDSRIIANTAQFLSRLCPQKEFVLRGFVRADVQSGPEYWISQHLDLYDMDDMIADIIRENFDSAVINEDMSIRELLKKQNEMREHMLDLSRDFLNNIWLYQHGIFSHLEYRITSRHPEAYFIEDEENRFVPAGWMMERKDSMAQKLIDAGFAVMNDTAVAEIEKFGSRVHTWAVKSRAACQEKSDQKSYPGIAGGIAAALVTLIVMWCLARLSSKYLQGAAPLLIGGFALSFLAALTLVYGAVTRFSRLRIWRRMNQSEKYLEEIVAQGNDIAGRIAGDKGTWPAEILPAKHNLDAGAQKERAYCGYLAAKDTLSNKMAGMYVFIVLSLAVLFGGLYMDGHIDPAKGNFPAQVAGLFSAPEESGGHKADGKDVRIVSVSSARLRSGPGKDTETISSYPRGTEVTLTGSSQSDGQYDWYEVSTPDGSVGWMREDMLKQN
ncbi:MAG: protein kinase domain-containing protein [Lachnospiraceae bacterium]